MAKLNDLIRCEDAIKEICKRTCTPGVLCPDAYCKEVKEWITDDMVVDAVPVRHGQWMEIAEAEMFMCSECGEPGLSFDDVYIYDLKPANFCPNCGADMRKDGGDD